MHRINFGTGSHHQLAENKVIDVPSSGSLPLIDFSEFKDEPGIRFPNCIIVCLPDEKFSSPIYLYDEIRIFWIEERQEWVAFRCTEEANPTTWPDMFVEGPYVLDQDALLTLSQVFRVDQSIISLEQLAKTSPEKLDELYNTKILEREIN